MVKEERYTETTRQGLGPTSAEEAWRYTEKSYFVKKTEFERFSAGSKCVNDALKPRRNLLIKAPRVLCCVR